MFEYIDKFIEKLSTKELAMRRSKTEISDFFFVSPFYLFFKPCSEKQMQSFENKKKSFLSQRKSKELKKNRKKQMKTECSTLCLPIFNSANAVICYLAQPQPLFLVCSNIYISIATHIFYLVLLVLRMCLGQKLGILNSHWN